MLRRWLSSSSPSLCARRRPTCAPHTLSLTPHPSPRRPHCCHCHFTEETTGSEVRGVRGHTAAQRLSLHTNGSPLTLGQLADSVTLSS